jgi:hypothetical protein
LSKQTEILQGTLALDWARVAGVIGKLLQLAAGRPVAALTSGLILRECRMKEDAILVVTSVLSLLLLTLHITDDIVRGISKAESSNTALLVLVILLYGTLVLAGRRSGYIIMLLVGLFAAAMPVMHMRGAHYPDIARSPGGFFFVWTLWALGGIGGLTFVLSARGLWRLGRLRKS